jgi:precorrin-4/cobalt-precorrin-4 C11-methyltransferase
MAPANATIINTAPMLLPEIIGEIKKADARGVDIARVHSGDPSIYGAIGEQMAELDALGIEYEIVPGVPAFAAAAASLKREFTLPGITQSIVLTRTARNSSAMPDAEKLADFAKTGATLVLHLSIKSIAELTDELLPFYGSECPAAVVYKASWSDEIVITETLAKIAKKAQNAGIERTALVIVGPALSGKLTRTSALYTRDHARH